MICWQVPVLASFPSPLVPATSEGLGKNAPAKGNVVACPSRVRLSEDMWVSSRTFFVLDAEVWCALSGREDRRAGHKLLLYDRVMSLKGIVP